MRGWEKASYGALIVAQAMASQLAIEIGAGRVPVPERWQWMLPVAQAGLMAISLLLPSVRRPT